MKKYINLSIFILSVLYGSAQKPSIPAFGESAVEFKTAKISVFNVATNKYSSAIYNDATITIDNNNSGITVKIKIDISNKFFLKEGDFSMASYKHDDDLDYFTFTSLEGTKYICITFYYSEYSEQPTQILVFGTEDLMAKNQKRFTYLLTEFK
jgi:hypothetical protein